MAQLRPILLVEDSPRDVELVLAALKKHNLANEVAVAQDGVQALDFLYRRGEYESRAAGEPIVIFLDLKMPRKDGLEVLGEIKADPVLRTIPIVMLTSSREEADLVRSYRLGVNAYVVKPVGFQEFMDAIKQTGMFWAVVNEPPPAAA
jgi:CheY-like chemotaxis protein